MPEYPDIRETLNLVRRLHAGQTDKIGHPYIEHLLAVRANLHKVFPDYTEAEDHACLLHDVLEDTDLSEADLRRLGYSNDVVEIVQLVSKNPEFSHRKNIDNLISSGNVSALRVKYADNMNNLDPARVDKLPEESKGLVKRYRKDREFLAAALAAHSITPRPR